VSSTRFYDPAHLVREVRELLHAHQLDTDLPGDEHLARTGASMMLRAFGITPAVDGVEALARAMDKPWVEADELRGDRQ
jgi:hypothetical protein